MRLRFILLMVSYFATTLFALAQTDTGVIRGTVQDFTGAVFIDVHVTLVEEATNQTWKQTTNKEGLFEFRALPFGKYRVEVDAVSPPHFVRPSPFRSIGCASITHTPANGSTSFIARATLTRRGFG